MSDPAEGDFFVTKKGTRYPTSDVKTAKNGSKYVRNESGQVRFICGSDAQYMHTIGKLRGKKPAESLNLNAST